MDWMQRGKKVTITASNDQDKGFRILESNFHERNRKKVKITGTKTVKAGKN